MAHTKSTYSKIAGLWSLVFFLVALLFLFAPDLVGASLNSMAKTLGFSGEITTQGGMLWKVLTLSLMGTITFLAHGSARHPERKALYQALLLAKTISVAGFLALAYTNGPAWYICAGADAVVALSLILTYKIPEIPGMTAGFAAVGAKAPFYEVYYGKIDLSPGRAFWFRYTSINGVRKEASTWAIYFGETISTGKNTAPLVNLAPPNAVIIPSGNSQERFQNNPQVYHLGASHLDGANAIGEAGDISWDLTFKDSGLGFEHVPPLVKALKVAKSNYFGCCLDLRFSGTIRCGTETFSLSDRPGMIGHIHGKKSAHSWAWAHCNNFDRAEHVIFEGLSARIELGGKPTKPLSSFILITPESRYEFSTTRSLLKSPSAFGNGEWTFESRSKDAVIKGKAKAPDHIALVEYTDTDDSNLWCYNSKLASLEIELTDLKTGALTKYASTSSAAFELVNRDKPQVPVVL